MSFYDSKHQSLKSSGFNGGIIKHVHSTLTDSDYIYRDTQNDDLVLFSGHIFNRIEIADKLGLDAEKCYDPELAYYAFLKHGPDFVKMLNGEFAIAINQPSIKRSYLLRDHLGVRPLAYTIQDNSLCFSSDIISLCRTFHAREEKINSEPLLKNFKLVDYTQTYNHKVKKLLPGHYLEHFNGQVKIQKYWKPERIRIDRSLRREKMFADMAQLLEKAVKIRSDKRYRAAAHMSGGLDSGIVAAFAKNEYAHQDEFYGYSWSPEDESSEELKFDERKLVEDQSKLNDIIAVFAKTAKADYLYYSSRILNNSEYIDENYVLKHAQQQNINLIFSGHGGDEFISKGERGVDTDLLLNLQLRPFFKSNPLHKPKKLLRVLLYEIFMPYFGILSFPIKKGLKEEAHYLKEGFNKQDKIMMRNFYFYRSRRKLHLGFLHCYYLPERMEEWFVNGSRHGIEYRYPLLDKEIVEYMLKIPSKLLITKEYSRSIIREISEGILPESVRWRKTDLDPAIIHFAKKTVIDCCIDYVHEIESFKKNPDLDFIDFDKFEPDIDRFRQNPDKNTDEDLIYTLLFFKQLDAFTKAYRKLPATKKTA